MITAELPTPCRSASGRPRIGLFPVTGKGDLLFGSNNSQIATLLERHTRYVMLVGVKSKDSNTVINALLKPSHK